MATLYALRLSLVSLLFLLAGVLLSLAIPPLFTPIKPTTLALDVRGGGWLGYRFGFAGSVLLLVAQMYSFKLHRLKGARIPSKTFLDVHCYLSTVGGLLILIHSGFPIPAAYIQPFAHIYPGRGVEGLVGVQWIAAWLVILLTVSGFYGRYLYGRRPPTGPLRPFRYWLLIHTALSGALYVLGIIHLILVLVIKHVPAI